LGYAKYQLGLFADAERELRAAEDIASRIGLPSVVAGARHNLGIAIARQGRLDEAREVEEQAVEWYRSHGYRRMEGGSRSYLAAILALGNHLGEAESEAKAAMALLHSAAPLLLPLALATLAHIELLQGRADAALATATDAISRLNDAAR